VRIIQNVELLFSRAEPKPYRISVSISKYGQAKNGYRHIPEQWIASIYKMILD